MVAIPADIAELNVLYELVLNGNSLKELPTEIGTLTLLTQLPFNFTAGYLIYIDLFLLLLSVLR